MREGKQQFTTYRLFSIFVDTSWWYPLILFDLCFVGVGFLFSRILDLYCKKYFCFVSLFIVSTVIVFVFFFWRWENSLQFYSLRNVCLSLVLVFVLLFLNLNIQLWPSSQSVGFISVYLSLTVRIWWMTTMHLRKLSIN